MMDYYDNPEGLEPEDYIEEYGEAGHSAWDERSHTRPHKTNRQARQNWRKPTPSPNDSDAYVGIVILFVAIFLFISLMILIF